MAIAYATFSPEDTLHATLLPVKTILAVSKHARMSEASPNVLSLSPQHTLLLVATGQAALHAVAQVKPHLILVDAQLSGMTGLALCFQLSQIAALADVPTILLAAEEWQQEIISNHTPQLVIARTPLDVRALVHHLARTAEEQY